MQKVLLCSAALFSGADAARSKPVASLSSFASTVQTYAKDCGQIPGAGLGKVTPFQTVLKDGFMQSACVKDMMWTYGDKFGGNKHQYNLGDVSNVSIVHYKAVVAKEDRQEMTHETCFEFCRTVPDMLYFGLINGRDCYCAPYFEAMAGDSSDCDEVCAAKPTQMCGGKTKSQIFEMHQCADTAANLKEAASDGSKAHATLTAAIGHLKAIATAMQTGAAANQDTFGKDGNPAAANLFQQAKEFAGEVLHAAEADQETATALDAATSMGTKLSGAVGLDSEYETNKKAQEVTEELKNLIDKAGRDEGDATKLAFTASPAGVNHTGEPSKQYYSLMYFVDKKYVKVPSTCTGESDHKPMVSVSIDDCAQACDAALVGGGACVGFSYYPDGEFCFLFSKFTEATYYTKCDSPSFLQQPMVATAKPVPQCYGKLSEFEGTTIAPDASGKCEGCLTKATEAARCYK